MDDAVMKHDDGVMMLNLRLMIHGCDAEVVSVATT